MNGELRTVKITVPGPPEPDILSNLSGFNSLFTIHYSLS